MERRALSSPSPTQQVAVWLYECGFNVGVQPYGSKKGLPHYELQHTRLYHNPVPDEARPDDLLDVTQGRCNLTVYTGRTSKNLFIFDCETGASLYHMIVQLTASNIRLWAVASPSAKGGGHIYLLCTDGEIENVPAGTHRDLEVWGNRHYVLTVNSKHPEPADVHNSLYQWLKREGDDPPSATLQQLERLTDLDGKTIRLTTTRRTERKTDPHPFTPHSKATEHYLSNGISLTEGYRHQAAFEALADFARCNYSGYPGYSRADAEHQIGRVARGSGLPTEEVNRLIERVYDSCTIGTYKAQGKPQHRAWGWQYALTFCNQHQWTGRSGTSERGVFLALIERAREGSNNHGTFRASVRETAERARVSALTARRTLKKLRTATPPLICYAGQDGKAAATSRDTSAKRATLWRFSDYVMDQGRKLGESNPVRSTIGVLSSSGILSPNGDVVERGALGPVGLQIYQVMLSFDQPASLKEIAARAQLTVAKVRYHIVGQVRGGGKLLASGLVKRSGRSYLAEPATDDVLEQRISVPYGTAGKGAHRREEYATERALYAGNRIIAARYKVDRANFLFGETPTLEQGAAGAEILEVARAA
jgi:hypothetical protein